MRQERLADAGGTIYTVCHNPPGDGVLPNFWTLTHNPPRAFYKAIPVYAACVGDGCLFDIKILSNNGDETENNCWLFTVGSGGPTTDGAEVNMWCGTATHSVPRWTFETVDASTNLVRVRAAGTAQYLAAATTSGLPDGNGRRLKLTGVNLGGAPVFTWNGPAL